MKQILSLAAALIIALTGLSPGLAPSATAATTLKHNMKLFKSEGSFEKPDFNYPKTVLKNARPEIERGLKRGKPEVAFNALLQVSAAETRISSDKVGECLALIDSVAEKLPAGWRSLAYLLEADIVNEVYGSDSWRYDERKLPADERPEEMTLWDGRMFRDEVRRLIEKSLAEAPVLPLSEFSDVLTPKAATGYLLSDFLYAKSTEILQSFKEDSAELEIIPFTVVDENGNLIPGESSASDLQQIGPSSTEKYLFSLVDRWEETLTPESEPNRWAIFLDFHKRVYRGLENAKWLRSQWSRLEGNRIQPLLLPYLSSSEISSSIADNPLATPDLKTFYSPKECFARLKAAVLKDSGESKIVKASVENLINKWSTPSADFSITELVAPQKSLTVKLTDRNLEKGAVVILRVPESFPIDLNYIEGLAKLRYCTVVAEVPFRVEDSIPFEKEVEVTIPSLTPGRYTAVVTRDGSLNTIVAPSDSHERRFKLLPIFNVTNLSSFGVAEKGERPGVYIVSNENGEPIEGAKIHLESQNEPYPFTRNLQTDSEGFFEIPTTPDRVNWLEMTASKGDSYLFRAVTSRETSRTTDYPTLSAKIFFDRPIARPGDEVSFAVVAYEGKDKSLSPLKDSRLNVILKNASWVEVDTLSLTTDASGRCEGKFKVPDGMLGVWRIKVERTIEKERDEDLDMTFSMGSSTLRVEEYKNPTNRIVLDAPETESDSVVLIKGRVETYSGMPVPGSKVSLKIETRSPWWWRWSAPDGEFSTETVTGADGTFAVRLSRSGLKDTSYANSSYTLTATSVSEGGDVATDSRGFSLGDVSAILPDVSSKIQASCQTIRLNVRVLDGTGLPEKRTLRYRLTSLTDSAFKSLEGTFTSPLLELKSSELPSGTYRIEFTFDGEGFSDEVSSTENSRLIPSSTFTLWRDDDRNVPSSDPVWVPRTSVTTEEGAKTVAVHYGAAREGQWILCVVSDSQNELFRRWVKSSGKMTSISVPAPDSKERIFVAFTTVDNFTPVTETVTILPASQRKRLQVKTVTFRDRLASGSKESWSFRFTHGAEEGATNVSSLAVMTDAALESLAPMNWDFSPLSTLSWSPAVQFRTNRNGLTSYNFSIPIPYSKSFDIQASFPSSWIWDPYQREIQIRGGRGYFRSFKGQMNAMMMEEAVCCDSAPPMASPCVAEVADMESDSEERAMVEPTSDVFYSANTGSNDADEEPSETFRESECPVAFFRPMMTSDEEGNLTIDFEVPDFNTDWNFRLVGYDREMDASSLLLSAVSSKPVMVQTSLPRFVRTGDKVVLTARAFNNSDRDLALGGRIEILNPANGEVIESRRFDGENTAPAGSRLFAVEFNVPATLYAVVVRARAEADGNSDGEQSVLAVLPSSSPVVESTDFYLSPGEREFSVKIPKMKKDSSVTLLYCDNPAWYCLTALPAMVESQSKTLTSLVYAYYGNAIANGLLTSRPDLRRGLEEIDSLQKAGETDILTSNLERNAALKIRELGLTPWVNSARAETARMGSLVNLLDSTRSTAILDKLLGDIYNLRNSDGGMLWYPGAHESSVWCTGRMLLWFSMLNRFGYLPTEDSRVKELVSGGFAYTQKEIVEEWEKRLKDYKDEKVALQSILPTMTNYLYVCSAFRGSDLLPTENGQFADLAKRSLKMIGRSWGEMSVYDQATAAVLLADRGERKTALKILGSLSEVAMSSERKGMWFDNLDGGLFSPWNKLITTAQVLEAFSAITPEAPEVEGLRQWLLLQRQAEEWGLDSNTAELVQAILSSGTDWTGDGRGTFRLSAGGKTLLESEDMPSYGEVTLSLSPSDVSGMELLIERDGSDIAWGAVVEQYVAPMKDIRPASIPDLSVEKSVFVLRTVDGSEKALSLSEAGELKVGDKVRVLLTVDCGRDMEYVVLTDERGACLEPSDPLSGVDLVDGRFLYREVRNSSTNFFITYLPKGRYQFSYDCRLTSAGTFTAGIASLQSQYAPQLTAHSAAVELRVKK